MSDIVLGARDTEVTKASKYLAIVEHVFQGDR